MSNGANATTDIDVMTVLIASSRHPGLVIQEALSQEGISAKILQSSEVPRLKQGQYPKVRLAIVVADLTAEQRSDLKGWRDAGGAVIVTRADQWPESDLKDWFGVAPVGLAADHGHLWPQGAFSLPALPAENPLQIPGFRNLVRQVSDDIVVLAQGSIVPRCVAALDATRDGFVDDEWFWLGNQLIQYRRGRNLVSTFRIGDTAVAPDAATAGDFSGNGMIDNPVVAKGSQFWILRDETWTEYQVSFPIRHGFAAPSPDGTGQWYLYWFYGDGSKYQIFRGAPDNVIEPFSDVITFAPAGAPLPTDFSLSYEYTDEKGVWRTAYNLFARGVFFVGDATQDWNPVAFVPDLGPRYLFSNIMSPTLGYASDALRLGHRNQISLMVRSNGYLFDAQTESYNYPYSFHAAHKVPKWPLVVKSGRAIGFLFDLEESIRLLQQGTPITEAQLDWILQFQPNGFTPVINAFCDFVDYTNYEVPQADLHERLLRQAVSMVLDVPLPRLWYWPNGMRCSVSLSHDVETLEQNVSQQPAVVDSVRKIAAMATQYGHRDVFFFLTVGNDASMVTPTLVRELQKAHHDVTVHFDAFNPNGTYDFSPEWLSEQCEVLLRNAEGTLSQATGTRSHGLAYFKTLLPKAIEQQRRYGMFYDSSFGGGPGYSHSGSILPYRIYDADRQPFPDLYEIPTGLMDIGDCGMFFEQLADSNYAPLALNIQDLFQRARKMSMDNMNGYYGILDMIFHPVVVAGLAEVWNEVTREVVTIPAFFGELEEFYKFLAAQNVPVFNLVEAAQWWRGRGAMGIGDVQWGENGLLSFQANGVVDGTTVLLQQQYNGKTLQSAKIASTGSNLALRQEVIDNIPIAMIALPKTDGPCSVEATYS